MEMILIALVIGFAGGALGALVAVDTKTADITTTLKSLYKLQTDIETRIEKNEKRASLLNDAVRIIAQEQETNRAKLWGSINMLWQATDSINASITPKEPAQEPEQAEQGITQPEPEQPAEQSETKPKQAKPKAKKKPEGEKHD